MNRFLAINSRVACLDIVDLARKLSESACAVFMPGDILVVDESVYEYSTSKTDDDVTKCNDLRFIPRKPHPNGFLVYCLCGIINLGGRPLPVAFDFEPYITGNRISAQDAMITFFLRSKSRWTGHPIHFVVDSAFGSFDRMDQIVEFGGDATMSMSSTVYPWLWELLDYRCGINQGRVAYIPTNGVVVASYVVKTNSDEIRQLKIISSACKVEDPEGEDSAVVVKVSDSKVLPEGKIEFLAHFSDGDTAWMTPRELIGVDGNVDISLLEFVTDEDLTLALKEFTRSELQVMFCPIDLN